MTQNDKIMEHLLTGASITPLEGLQIAGSLRLSERIRELEREGVDIDHEMVRVGDKRVCRYKLRGFAYG